MEMKAPVKLDKKTKNLIGRINEGEIAIIDHSDIDEVAANSLITRRVAAVINCSKSISGRYPNLGPSLLKKSNVLLFDVVKGNLFNVLKDGDIVEIRRNELLLDNTTIATLESLSFDKVNDLLELAEQNIEVELEKFIDNTLTYAYEEKNFILGKLVIPKIETNMNNKQVLVVVRGQNYQEDLQTIFPYIKEMKPVLIGVDGGGDALLEFGLIPDIIIGDMDSVSDRCLTLCKEIIVHAYPNGDAPGIDRIKRLGLHGEIFPAPGTSEDIAMLLAYDQGADLIVAVGTHSNMIDFLEKGRKGMSSTFLVRLKVGSKLIDAKGVSKLYKSTMKIEHVVLFFIAALIPIIILLFISQPIRNLFKLLTIRLRIFLGI
ncbi:Uncharacterized membrane-anchored protein [Natronincola peptidivorans]|uniref:Uncharacterized membrane-anchored protein n=1 Tax=Natronincola peptidivorans TaxID=426128 RepID=A0A1H9YN99_9FIRM|nr:putative cytokinetic ring protein SteA [Natronincola peptidivorans]SES70532.1 Uncharacterized membrane-anchored protein [Natronincola peptidivorans]